METGWDASAQAWLDHIADTGDFARRYVMDTPMLERVRRIAPGNALDIGCGEWRFCRMMQELSVQTTGIDPTADLLAVAREKDDTGQYVQCLAEDLPFVEATFDLAVAYLSLIDVPDLDAAISELVRVLKPGGHVLIANLQSYTTAWEQDTIERLPAGPRRVTMLDYLEDRGFETEWAGIRIMNYHRPMMRYVRGFLSRGLNLTHYDEPRAQGGSDVRCAQYNHAPWCVLMEWQKPATASA